MKYTTREEAYHELLRNRNPELDLQESVIKAANAKNFSVNASTEEKFITKSMQPIDEDHQLKTFEAAEKVKKHIATALQRIGLSAEFRYQGSVIKKTNIKGYSDIDVLVIDQRCHILEHPQVAEYPYLGSPEDDLLSVRKTVSSHLSTHYHASTVDTSNAKCIKLDSEYLGRPVDIVPAVWFNTNEYANNPTEYLRGVHILDAHKRLRIPDRPFYHARLLDEKDASTHGRFRKCVRLLKNVKHVSELDMPSSFDIEAIVFAMGTSEMGFVSIINDVELAKKLRDYLARLENSFDERDAIKVPDGKRKVFSEGHTTLKQLQNMRSELHGWLVPIEDKGQLLTLFNAQKRVSGFPLGGPYGRP